MAAARRFKPPFVATVVPDDVQLLQGSTGPYALMREAVVVRDGEPDAIRTVMAFGPAYQQVSHLLQTGRAIDLSVRYDGGTLKVVGLPKGTNPLSLLVQHEEGRSYGETVALTLTGVLVAFGIPTDAVPGIVEDIMAGGVDDDEDRVFDVDPDLDEAHGHVLRPLANAQIEEEKACAIADAIAMMPISSWLDDVATLRRQNVAREFMLAA